MSIVALAYNPLARRSFMPRPSTKPPKRSPFANWLILARRERGWSQTALADAASVSPAAISKIESGGAFSRDMVERLARALTPDEADEHVFRSLLNAGIRAAFPRPEDEGQTAPTPRDLTRSIIRQKGFDEQEFSGQEVDQIQSGVEALIEGYLSRKRQDRGGTD